MAIEGGQAIDWGDDNSGSGGDPGIPDPANVRKGVLFGPNGSLVGTYDIFTSAVPGGSDIISMAVTALVQWLSSNIAGLTALDEWPYANQQLTYPSITAFAGQAKRMPLMKETVAVTAPNVNNQVVATEVVAEYDFEIQLDLWCRNKLERRQYLDKLLTAFNAAEEDITGANNPDGLTLTLSNYFNMPVRYEIDFHKHKDDEQAAERQERREMISVLVNLREVRQRTYYAMKSIETHVGVDSAQDMGDQTSSNTDTGIVF